MRARIAAVSAGGEEPDLLPLGSCTVSTLRDHPLLIDGCCVDVVLVEVSEDAGRAVVVASGGVDLDTLPEGTPVVLVGTFEVATAVAHELNRQGLTAVVEVDVAGSGVVDPLPFETLGRQGLAAGAVLSGDVEASDEAAIGWEIGAVWWLVANGVTTIRGVPPHRLRRVVAVARTLGVGHGALPSTALGMP